MSVRRTAIAHWIVVWIVSLSVVLLAPWAVRATDEIVPGPAQVSLKQAAQVEGATIYLGDIARIETADEELRHQLEQLEVGRAALPGMSRQITTGSIILRARQARLAQNIEFFGAENRIEVYTAAQTVLGQTIEDAIEHWYKERLTFPEDAVFRIDVDSPDVTVGIGDVEMRPIAGTMDWGRSLLTIEVGVPGEPAKRLQLSVTATVETNVYVARRHLARGETVQEGDVELQRLPLDRPASLFELGTVRTTRTVRAGAPLTWAVVESIPDVVRGERVRIEAGRGGVYVEIVGVAESDGRLGEEIAVRNENTGVTFTAVVVGPKRVRVAH